ncbi:hypothetical protein [Streptomyces sp. NPDC051211]|uniref:hypothetical protein n=1 Tax=Streptomyces sp. NPDC051211 TaxID=3154643 RepID=UPI00344B015F
MELIVLGVICYCVWVFVREAKKNKQAEEAAEAEAARQQRIKDPSSVGTEVAWTTRQGDQQKIQELVGQLPGWPVRTPVLHTAQWLGALSQGAGVADAAGVQKDITDQVRANVEDAMSALSAMAVKLVSLAQYFGEDWKALDAAVRKSLEAQAQQLNGICEAAASLHYSLGVAMVEHRGNSSSVTSVKQDLHALADAIRQISQRDRQF